MYDCCFVYYLFHTFIYLQGSQTAIEDNSLARLFHTFIYLQGSQTSDVVRKGYRLFHTFIYLQGSQTIIGIFVLLSSFTPLFTYKVLKPCPTTPLSGVSFTPLFTYKVLKLREE